MPKDVLAPCGLYCAVCLDNIVNHVCHGCGCACGECAGEAHLQGCEIAQCVSSKGFETCAECDDLPCTDLIHFAYHPFAIHHLQAIEVLRRVRKVGVEQVLAELRATFADEETRLQWAFIEAYGEQRYRAFEQWKADLQH
jgi:hypothetical protein